MKTITVKASRTYDVLIGRGLLSEVGAHAAKVVCGRNAAIVSDSNVAPLYLEALKLSLISHGFSVVSEQIVPAGEQSKRFSQLGALLEGFASAHLTRSDAVFALGGGVVGDMAGFASAIYLRGIACVQIPTSLLAIVDSSVGGKTAVDLDAGKNLAGVFAQPRLVICDPDLLNTLPEAYFRDGCGEIAKYAFLTGAPLYSLVLHTKENIDEIIPLCIEAKRAFVEEDEFDHGRRALLNLGHTFGHALELCSGYTVPHGSAVAMGCAAASGLALRLGVCEETLPEQVGALLSRLGLPTAIPFPAEKIFNAILSDKKRDGGSIKLILPVRIGECVPYEVNVREIPALLREVLS